MILLLSQLDQPLAEASPRLLTAHLLCSNGLAPTMLPANATMTPEGSVDLPGRFQLNQTPSVALKPVENQTHQWQVLELLSTNFSHLMNQTNPTHKLKQLLAILSRAQQPPAIIKSIQQVDYHATASRLQIDGKILFVPGTCIEITLAKPAREGRTSYHLFLNLLNQFFITFCSFDRFVSLKVNILGAQGKETLTFPPQQGVQQCL